MSVLDAAEGVAYALLMRCFQQVVRRIHGGSKRHARFAGIVLAGAIVATLEPSALLAEGWPTHRHDAARSGVTDQALTPPLHEAWVYQAKHAPRPAWPGPARRDGWHKVDNLKPRVIFDWAFHVVAGDDAVYFGSSADDKVYCLDAATGRERWSFFTDGPVRLAPTLADGRVYVGSDDGVVYCLNATDGSLHWKHRASPSDVRVPGNGRIMSLWPVRTGVLVSDGVAYFAAGLFPFEGAYICALDANDGQVLWKKRVDNVAPQGYLLASSTRLYVPTGRGAPVVFDRRDGRFIHALGGSGGAFCVLTKDTLIYGPGKKGTLDVFSAEERDHLATFAGNQIVVTPRISYLHTDTELSALDRVRYLDLNMERRELVRKQKPLRDRLKPRNRAIAYRPANHFHIGTYKDDNENQVFKGLIDEVRVWQTARTPDEIRADRNRILAGDEADLLGYWRFENISADATIDTTGGEAAVLHGGARSVPSNATSTVAPPAGHALAFNGQSSYVDAGEHDRLRPRSAVTVEAWINAAERETWSGIAGNIWDTGSTEAGYGLTLDDASGVWFGVRTRSQAMVYLSSGPDTIQLNRWHHVAGTYDGRTVKVFVDGVEMASRTLYPAEDETPEARTRVQEELARLRERVEKIGRELPTCITWKNDCKYPYSLVLAGGDVLYAGGTNQVAAFSAVDGKTLWVEKVNGRALDLALADDRLIVSTDRGTLHCFVAP